MFKILIAVDGSKHALNAVQHFAAQADQFRAVPGIELVTVQPPLPYLHGVKSVVGEQEIQRYYDEEGNAALKSARQVLDASGLRYESRILVGEVGETIVKHAHKAGCGLIVIATRGMGAVGNLLLGSVATKVLHLSRIPVLVVK